ncbi:MULTISPECIES: TraR/DksA family transcriptional regulator [Rhodanobacter]|uniref:TraR/DksA family transcriptional regulator n=1 Tax=Rhodanobacter TaxID=75309 RepID=UPI00040C0847|nr:MULTISPECIES: TraR/DksA C4-type zinc finger protein [Rhodanobacter]UJJ53367.1 molecular chaperone DnaK [Rhodanobacter thiooxydans]
MSEQEISVSGAHPTTDRRTFCHEMANVLLQKRLDLMETIEQLKASGGTVELDQTLQGRLSRMDAMAQQQMAKAGHTRLTIELQRISAALKRFEEDRYGVCCRCKEDIQAERLMADPAAPFCMGCVEEIAEEKADRP